MRKFTEISAMAIAVILGTSVMITGCGANGSQEADGEAAKTEEKSSAGGEDGVFTIAYAPNESTDQSLSLIHISDTTLSEVLWTPQVLLTENRLVPNTELRDLKNNSTKDY